MKYRTSRLLKGLALTLVLGTTSSALPLARQEASEAAAQALPSATGILDKFVEVTNAKAMIEKTSCVHRKGKISMAAMGLEGTMETWSRKPNVSIVKMDMGAMGAMSQGFDGKVGWQMNAMMGPRLFEGPELLLARLEANYGSIKDPSMYESIETMGREKFEGKDCYDVKLVAKPLEGMDAASTLKARTFHEFYDVETGLLVGRVNTSQSQMGEMEVTTVVSDYEKFGEVLIPTKTVQKLPMGEFTMEVTSVEFPDEVDEAVFALPEEVAAQIEKSK